MGFFRRAKPLHEQLAEQGDLDFVNIETGQQNVVYRRRDGAYGLIEPQQ